MSQPGFVHIFQSNPTWGSPRFRELGFREQSRKWITLEVVLLRMGKNTDANILCSGRRIRKLLILEECEIGHKF